MHPIFSEQVRLLVATIPYVAQETRHRICRHDHTPVALEQLLAVREQMIATLHRLLTDQDREFLLSVKRGKPDWGLCALPNAANLPAVRWKLHNLAAMKPAQHKQALAKLERVLAAP